MKRRVSCCIGVVEIRWWRKDKSLFPFSQMTFVMKNETCLVILLKDINNIVLYVIIVLKFFFLCMKFNLER